MRFHTSLEEVNTLRTIAVWRNFLTTCIMQFRHLAYERNHIAQELHQAVNAHRLTCTNAEYREDATGNQSLANALAKFIFCQTLALEELLHQSLIVLGCSLNKSRMKFHGFLHFFFWNIFNNRSTALRLPGIFFHQ